MKIQPYIANYANVQNNINVKPKSKNCTFRAYPDTYCYHDRYFNPEAIPKQKYIPILTRSTVGNPVTDERLKCMMINSFKDIGNGCYKGGLAGAADYVKQLKEFGIKKFIMLCEPEECNMIEECKKYDVPIDVIHMPVYELNSEDRIRKFKNKTPSYSFVDSIMALREGNCFVGCESGNIRTKKFLSVIQILDPECKLNLSGLTAEKGDYQIARIIYNRLSEDAKKLLGYTPEFKKELISMFKKFGV